MALVSFKHACLLLSFTIVYYSNAESVCHTGCRCVKYTDVSMGLVVSVDCTPPSGTEGQISYIPDDLPEGVTRLILDHNALDSLSSNVFSRYSQLKTLSLVGNAIKTVEVGSFSNLNELTNLDLSRNKIESIDPDVFSDVPKVEILHLDGNKLTSIQASTDLSELTEVNLGSNRLVDCTFPREFASNKLRAVTLSENPCNTITSSTFANLAASSDLTCLTLSNTSVSAIADDAFANLLSIEELDLSKNSYLNWSVIQKLKYPPNLHILNLNSMQNGHQVLTAEIVKFLPNSLTMLQMSYSGFVDEMPDFRGLGNLTYLYIEGNDFTSLPNVGESASGFPDSLEHFYARSNKISHVFPGAFANLKNLQTVDLSYNTKMSEFSPSAFGDSAPSMSNLFLSGTLLGFPKGVLPTVPNLERLILDENDFEELDADVRTDFDKLQKLQKLDLTGNKLRSLPPAFFKTLNKLTHLLLNDNSLGQVISNDDEGLFFDGLLSINNINLEENDIEKIPPKLFSLIGSDLQTLDLLGNKLKKFPGSALNRFRKLKLITLDANEFTVFSPDDFSGMNPKAVINLWTNPIDCSCNNYNFFRWLDQTAAGETRPTFREMKCHTPVELANKLPPSASLLSASCANSSGATAVIVFFVVVCLIIAVILVAWFAARKLRHYFPYKRLGPNAANRNLAAPGINMSGLDDTDEAFQM